MNPARRPFARITTAFGPHSSPWREVVSPHGAPVAEDELAQPRVAAAELPPAIAGRALSSAGRPFRFRLRRVAAEPASTLTAAVEQWQRRAGRTGGGGDEEGFGGGGLRSQVNGLVSEIDGSGVQQGTLSGPTPTQQMRLTAAKTDFDKLHADAERVLSHDLGRLNAALDRLGIPRIAVPPSRTPSAQ